MIMVKPDTTKVRESKMRLHIELQVGIRVIKSGSK